MEKFKINYNDLKQVNHNFGLFGAVIEACNYFYNGYTIECIVYFNNIGGTTTVVKTKIYNAPYTNRSRKLLKEFCRTVPHETEINYDDIESFMNKKVHDFFETI